MSLAVENIYFRPYDTAYLLEPKTIEPARQRRLGKAFLYFFGSVELSPVRAERWHQLAAEAMEYFESINPQHDVYHSTEYHNAVDLYNTLPGRRGKVPRCVLARGVTAIRAHRAATPQPIQTPIKEWAFLP